MSVCVAWGTHSEMDSLEVDGLHARRAQVESGRAHLFGRRVRATARSGALASHFGFGGHGRLPMCSWNELVHFGRGGFGCSVGQLPRPAGVVGKRCDVALLLHGPSSISGNVAEPQGAVLLVPAWPFVSVESLLS